MWNFEPALNVNSFTVPIYVEETTGEITAHHFQGRVLGDQDDERGQMDLTMNNFIAIDLFDYFIC